MNLMTHSVYRAAELKDYFPKAFQHAFEAFRQTDAGNYPWYDEVSKTLEQFLALFDCQLLSWDVFALVDRFSYHSKKVTFQDGLTYAFDEITGDRLVEYFNEHLPSHVLRVFKSSQSYPLTGMIFDEAPLQVIRQALIQTPTHQSLGDLIDQAIDELLQEVEEDMHYYESEEHFIQTSDELEIFFTPSGQPIR